MFWAYSGRPVFKKPYLINIHYFLLFFGVWSVKIALHFLLDIIKPTRTDFKGVWWACYGKGGTTYFPLYLMR